MDKNKYFLTGEFAKIMNVTKNTLFHYDKIGLFSPEIKLDNEYRYYSVQQMESMRIILMLKELGMPLTEIKEYLDGNTTEDLLLLYEQEAKKITQRLQDLKEKKEWICGQQLEIQEFSSTDISQIYQRKYPARYYLFTQAPSSDERTINKKIGNLIELYNETSQSYGYKICFIQHSSNVKQHIYNDYTNVALILSKKPKGTKYKTRPAGIYLIVYHKGHWNSIADAYTRLINYANEHDISIEDDFFEIDVIDRLYVKDYNEFVTEISVRISPFTTST